LQFINQKSALDDAKTHFFLLIDGRFQLLACPSN
jgi:hypothetical protein